jgi:hypothetical protein
VSCHLHGVQEDLRQYQPIIKHDSYKLRGGFRSGTFLPLELSTGMLPDGRRIENLHIIASIDPENSEYRKFDILGDNFTEMPRMVARRKDEKRSPIEKWKDPAFLEEVFTAALTSAMSEKHRSPYLPAAAPPYADHFCVLMLDQFGVVECFLLEVELSLRV